jgi:integrase
MKYTFYLAYPNAEQTPIMLALREGTKRITISLGVKINPEYWDKEDQRAKKGSVDYRYINEKILEAEKAAERALNYGKLDNLSLQDVANIYRKEVGLEVKEEKSKAELFMPFYRMWAHTSFGKHIARRANAYRFRVFEKFLGKAEPTFDEIDYNLYIRFLTELQEKGYKPNMQGSFIKDIKAAMNEAYKRGLHTHIAYQRFEKPSEQVTTIYLTQEEVDKIYNPELSGGLEMARDIFILGCYTGLRFSDYSRLTVEDAEGEFITKIQQKTLNEVCIPVHPRVRAVLKKWNGAPNITQQKTNLYIKSICAQVGMIDDIEVTDNGEITHKKKWEMVSTHTARRTAATNLLLSGATIYEVMRFLGHTSVTQTETYLRITSKENAKILAKNKFFSGE